LRTRNARSLQPRWLRDAHALRNQKYVQDFTDIKVSKTPLLS